MGGMAPIPFYNTGLEDEDGNLFTLLTLMVQGNHPNRCSYAASTDSAFSFGKYASRPGPYQLESNFESTIARVRDGVSLNRPPWRVIPDGYDTYAVTH